MSPKFIPKALASTSPEDQNAVLDALILDPNGRKNWIERFEKDMGVYTGAQYAIAFSSTTSAFDGAYFAAGLMHHDRIFASANSAVESILSPMHKKVPIQFCDIELETGNISINRVGVAVETFESYYGRPIILASHYSGVAVDMKALYGKIVSPETLIIEDGTQALGSNYPSGERVGSCHWSDLTVFSLDQTRIITGGIGGVVTTNSYDLAKRLLLYRSNGISQDYQDYRHIPYPGYEQVEALTGGHTPSQMQCALAQSQLYRIETLVRRRRVLMGYYRRELGAHPLLQLYPHHLDAHTAYGGCPIRIQFASSRITRKKLIERLLAVGIEATVWHIPLYHHPVSKEMVIPHDQMSTPNTEIFYTSLLNLPFYNDLSKEDIFHICHQVRRFL
jgi:dTDP-4-amino-4,6-dideoxygalactose transaminase